MASSESAIVGPKNSEDNDVERRQTSGRCPHWKENTGTFEREQMSDRSKFEHFLRRRWRYYRATLTNILGPFDTNFVFGSIKGPIKNHDAPQVHFPDGYDRGGGCVADIRLSAYPWKNCHCGQGGWQVAHETVHLLDPVPFGEANVLEEGLATWFQDEPEFHDNEVKRYISQGIEHTVPYLEARDLVRRCMPGLLQVVKEIRSLHVAVSEITADLLGRKLHQVDVKTIERLCSKFSD